MGSGKSTVGRLAAQLLGWRFIDLDTLIEERQGRSIAEIFSSEGEEGFRQAELAELQGVLAALQDDAVVALGGGTPTREEARRLLREKAVVIYLRVPSEVSWERVREAGGRPLARDADRFAALASVREELYTHCATAVVDALGPPEEVALAVVEVVARQGWLS